MNLREESIKFVNYAFDLIEGYNSESKEKYIGENNALPLVYPYSLGISEDGLLILYKAYKGYSGMFHVFKIGQSRDLNVIGYSIGKLLAYYLDYLDHDSDYFNHIYRKGSLYESN